MKTYRELNPSTPVGSLGKLRPASLCYFLPFLLKSSAYILSPSLSLSHPFHFFLHLTLLLKENPVCLYLFWHMVSMSCFSLRVAHHVLINSMSNNYSLSRRESITKTQLQSPRSGWAVEPPLVAGGRTGGRWKQGWWCIHRGWMC